MASKVVEGASREYNDEAASRRKNLMNDTPVALKKTKASPAVISFVKLNVY